MWLHFPCWYKYREEISILIIWDRWVSNLAKKKILESRDKESWEPSKVNLTMSPQSSWWSGLTRYHHQITGTKNSTRHSAAHTEFWWFNLHFLLYLSPPHFLSCSRTPPTAITSTRVNIRTLLSFHTFTINSVALFILRNLYLVWIFASFAKNEVSHKVPRRPTCWRKPHLLLGVCIFVPLSSSGAEFHGVK